MKSKDLIVIGGLLVGAYFLFRMFQGKSAEGGGGGGGSLTDWFPELSQEAQTIINSYDTRGFTLGGVPAMDFTYVAPSSTKNAVIQALQGGATVYSVKRAQSNRVDWVGVPKTGTRAAALTVGTPSQQIERFITGPRIVAGKKVM